MFHVKHVNVILFMPVSTLRPPLRRMHETHKCVTPLLPISYTPFHPNRKTNVESKDRNSFHPSVQYGFPCADFHETHSCSTRFLQNSYIDFHENLISGLFIDDIMSQTNRQTVRHYL
jgi:hypothetical protein